MTDVSSESDSPTGRPGRLKALARAAKQQLLSLWTTADTVARHKAVEVLEPELEELEHLFALLVQGAFVGVPSPPMQISLDLLPLMERDIIRMMDKLDTANEPLSHLFSTFEVL